MSNDTEKRKIKLSMEVNNEECDIVTHLNKNMVTDALDYIPIDEEEKGASPGVAELDETGKLPKDQLPPEATDVIIGYYNGGHFWKNKVGSAGSYQYSNMIMADSSKIYLDLGESLKWELYAYNDDDEAYVKITNKVEWEETVLETLNKLCAWYDSDNRIDTIYENDKPLQVQNHKVYTKNTTYSNMKKATDSAAGTSGLVPAPAAGNQNKFLRGDATWAIPSEAGKLSTARTIDGVKFDGSKNISHLGNCSSGENTVNKVVTCDGFVLSKGARITVIFSYTNKADDITLNVNNTGAKPVYYNASAMKSSNLRINADRAYDFVYDGTNWVHCGTVHYTAQNNTVENKKKRLLLSPTDTNDNEVYVTHKSENFTANPATGEMSAPIVRGNFDCNTSSIDTSTVTGKGLSSSFSGSGIENKTGYVAIARIKVSSKNIDSPILLVYVRRGDNVPTFLSIKFTNSDTTDPNVGSFTYFGNPISSAFINKEDISTWNIYVKKNVATDVINILWYSIPPNTSDGLSLTMIDTHQDDAISSWIGASYDVGLSIFVGSGSNSKSGLVPAPPKTQGYTRYLREDGSWTSIENMRGCTEDTIGVPGLVPAPAAGREYSFLRGDGVWSMPHDRIATGSTSFTDISVNESVIKIDIHELYKYTLLIGEFTIHGSSQTQGSMTKVVVPIPLQWLRKSTDNMINVGPAVKSITTETGSITAIKNMSESMEVKYEYIPKISQSVNEKCYLVLSTTKEDGLLACDFNIYSIL